MIPGIDIAVWDGHGFPYKTTNWAAYTWPFAWIKISEGTVIDPLFPRQWEAARGHTLRGPYHYFRPFVDPKTSALRAITYLDGDKGELPIALDIETTDGRTDTLARAKTWLSWYEQETGIRPIIYSRYSFLFDVCHAENHPWLENYKLWISRYPFDGIEDRAERDQRIAEVVSGAFTLRLPTPRAPFKRVCFYQWTALLKPEQVPGYYTGPRGKLEVDGNFYLGTEQELRDEFNISGPPIPDPEPEPPLGDPMLIGEVIVTELNIRPVAGTAEAAIGKLKKGDRVEASGEWNNGWWGITKITRANVNVPLPGPLCFAFEGENNGYIKDITPAPVPTGEFMLHVKDGVTRKFVPEK